MEILSEIYIKISERSPAQCKQRYGKIQVMGMTEPMPLGELFTDVHTLGRLTAHCTMDQEHWRELQDQFFLGRGYASEEAVRTSGDEVAETNKRLFIIGKPGAGKTTFLKHRAIQTVNERLERLPIFIPLKAFADSGNP